MLLLTVGKLWLRIGLGLSLALVPAWSYAKPHADWLLDLPLQQLGRIEVFTPGRQVQRLSETASAVHVITAQDIQRAGVTTVMEALRLAPGVNVARITSSSYAISIRGLSNRYSPKLLVLIDGRSVYNAMNGGVNWQVHDLPVEEIEQIEVIRGPGAALWGSNAVNGVINIITRSAIEDGQRQVTLRAGNEQYLAYGSQSGTFNGPGPDGHYRLFAAYKNVDEAVAPGGSGRNDQWHTERAGFRTDGNLADGSSLMLQGTMMNGHMRDTGIFVTDTPAGPVSGPHRREDPLLQNRALLGRWEQSLPDDGRLTVQTYYQYERIEYPTIAGKEQVFDLDFQHTFSLAHGHRGVWGAGARHIRNHLNLLPAFGSAVPQTSSQELFSAFLEDERSFLQDSLRATVGVKVEKNDFTGLEWQPNVRLIWMPAENHTLWTAVSRAVRTPATGERHIQFINLAVQPGPTLLQLRADDEVRAVTAENLTAFELGYRLTPASPYSLDVALFYNDYDDLASLEPGALECSNGSAPPGCAGGYLVLPLIADNALKASTYGGELALNWDPAHWWRVAASYSYYRESFRTRPGASGNSLIGDIGSTPAHTLNIRSTMEVSPGLELDLWYRYVDALPGLGIHSYSDLGLRIGYELVADCEIAFTAHHLLDSRRGEFNQQLAGSLVTEFGRSFDVGMRWTF